MKSKIANRIAISAVTIALAIGGVGLTAGTASAAPQWDYLSTDNGVGVYIQSNTTGGKVGAPDLFKKDGDAVYPTCWVAGQYLNNGDVWYHITGEWYDGQYTGQHPESFAWTGWVYGAYVDGNAFFHDSVIPHC